MRKLPRRILAVVLAVVAVTLVLSGVGVAMFKGTPAWYRAAVGDQPTDAERERLARAAENKMIEAQNWAATLRADAQRAQRAANASRGDGGGVAGGLAGAATRPAPAAPRAEATHVIAFTDEELNALFDKWSTLHGWRAKYAEYLEDPRIVLQEDRLILAGQMRELGAVVSFQFRPQLDESGLLRLDLLRVTGGRLPLPESIWAQWRDRIVASTRRHLPLWRAQARIDSAGGANFSAMAATLSRLLFAVADRQPAEPVLFFPLAGQRESVPVKVADLAIETGKLTLTVQPLTPAERAALLDHIRAPKNGDVAQASREERDSSSSSGREPG